MVVPCIASRQEEDKEDGRDDAGKYEEGRMEGEGWTWRKGRSDVQGQEKMAILIESAGGKRTRRMDKMMKVNMKRER